MKYGRDIFGIVIAILLFFFLSLHLLNPYVLDFYLPQIPGRHHNGAVEGELSRLGQNWSRCCWRSESFMVRDWLSGFKINNPQDRWKTTDLGFVLSFLDYWCHRY